MKLLFDEPESTTLVDWLNLRTEIPKVSSDLSTVDLIRSSQRIDESLVDDAKRLLKGVDHVVVRKLWLWHSANSATSMPSTS